MASTPAAYKGKGKSYTHGLSDTSPKASSRPKRRAAARASSSLNVEDYDTDHDDQMFKHTIKHDLDEPEGTSSDENFDPKQESHDSDQQDMEDADVVTPSSKRSRLSLRAGTKEYGTMLDDQDEITSYSPKNSSSNHASRRTPLQKDRGKSSFQVQISSASGQTTPATNPPSIFENGGSVDSSATSPSASVANSTKGSVSRRRSRPAGSDADLIKLERDASLEPEEVPGDDDYEANEAVSVSEVSEELESESDASEDDPIVMRQMHIRGRGNRRQAAPKISQYEKTRIALEHNHPELRGVWEELDSDPGIKVQKAEQPSGLSLKLLPFQLEGVHWMRVQETGRFNGGILADEMGMGKTIQTIGLLLSEPRGKPNLVVAPTVALMQWKTEIEMYTNNGLKIFLYYGSARDISRDKLMDFDVVLTTYSVIESVFRKQNSGFKRADGVVKQDSLLHKINFFRVILDEAHNIKDRSNNTARSIFALQCQRKLCLSGTPLQNRIGELFSLLRFLTADPFAYYFCKRCPCKALHWRFSDWRTCDECGHSPMQHTCWFNTELLKPIQAHGYSGPGVEAFNKVHKLLKHLMLRRTKVERADDLGLPPRVVEIRRDLFNEEEEDIYSSLYSASKRKFNTFLEEGVVLNNYANIFQLITRMRQMANHPDLVLAKKQNNLGVDRSEQLLCRVCDEFAEDAIESKCHHTFCRVCITEYIESSVEGVASCPVCHVPIQIDLSAPALENSILSESRQQSILNRIDMSRWRSSTKIEALVEELFKLRSSDRTIKSIVFSQFTSMLDLIGWRLRRAGFVCVKLDGSMTPEARAATINTFSTNPEVTVFLVSLKAGGVALNLTEASQVFIVDPWWNPATEWQAADRVHRLGQKRPIKITRLVVENSIESKIVELQGKKANMINATIGADEGALNRLTPDDLGFLFSN